MRKTLAVIATLCSLASAAPAFAAGSVEVSLVNIPRSASLASRPQTLGTLHFKTVGGTIDVLELPVALEWRDARKNMDVTFERFDIRNTKTGRTIDLYLLPEKSSATTMAARADDFVVENGDEWVVRTRGSEALRGASVRLKVITSTKKDPACKTRSASDPCNNLTMAKAEDFISGDPATVLPKKAIEGRWTKLR